MTLWLWIGGGLMALGTIVAIGPTRAAPAPRPLGAPASTAPPTEPVREEAPPRRRRGGRVKHPFRWIALAVGAGVCVLAVVLAVDGAAPTRSRSRTRAGSSASRRRRSRSTALDGTPITSDEPRRQDRARELLELVVHPVPGGARRADQLVRAAPQRPDVVLLGIVRDDTRGDVRDYVKERERHVAGRVRSAAAKAALDFGTRGQPETYAIGPTGVVAASKFGPVTPDGARPDGGATRQGTA